MDLDVGALFREHNDELYRYLVRLTDDETLARDAVQHAFLRLLETPPDDDNVRAWLYRVATNVVRDWGRNEQRHRRLLEERSDWVPVANREPQPDVAYESNEIQRRIRASLDGLSERDRTILLMREEGFPHRDIAKAVDTTTASIGTMIARALQRLSRTVATAEGGQS